MCPLCRAMKIESVEKRLEYAEKKRALVEVHNVNQELLELLVSRITEKCPVHRKNSPFRHLNEAGDFGRVLTA